MPTFYRRRIQSTSTTALVVVYALWLFLGFFGMHRFVTGRLITGLAMLALHILGWMFAWVFGLGYLLWAGLAVWWLIDGFLIPGMVRGKTETVIVV